VKLGGINAILEPQDISFLTDPENPTIVMGKSYPVNSASCLPLCWSGTHVVHPAPGSVGRPSFASLVGSIDNNAVRYVSTMEVQTSRKELIEAMESMCTVRCYLPLGEHDN
jgi:eukaryotic translation initiation factor 2C